MIGVDVEGKGDDEGAGDSLTPGEEVAVEVRVIEARLAQRPRLGLLGLVSVLDPGLILGLVAVGLSVRMPGSLPAPGTGADGAGSPQRAQGVVSPW